MPSLSKRIMECAVALPEAVPLCPGALLHLGSRAAALSRLVRVGRRLRVCRGVYMRPPKPALAPVRRVSKKRSPRSRRCGARPSFPVVSPPPMSSASPRKIRHCPSISYPISISALSFDRIFDANEDRPAQVCDGARPGMRKSFRRRPIRRGVKGCAAMRSPETRHRLLIGSRCSFS